MQAVKPSHEESKVVGFPKRFLIGLKADKCSCARQLSNTSAIKHVATCEMNPPLSQKKQIVDLSKLYKTIADEIGSRT